ncbi:hypothetical protein SAMN04487930_103175 [Cytophaga hutchinsonii ATCC 33406]|nr:hypothetical protein SAMN04487930_103175 [Cytophaga hutchinsonii ATCC 33406]
MEQTNLLSIFIYYLYIPHLWGKMFFKNFCLYNQHQTASFQIALRNFGSSPRRRFKILAYLKSAWIFWFFCIKAKEQ